MAHLGIGEKCTEKQQGTNINKNDPKEDVESFSWPGGLVRYAFATNYTTEERHTILDAMNNLAELVNSGSDGQKCISYTPFDPDKDVGKEYVWYYPGEGCESPVGAPHDDSNRHVSLSAACMERGVIQHELIHILGFWHEQSRPDRDTYVDIKWENIEDDTIVPKNHLDPMELGQREKPTEIDLMKIRLRYNCTPKKSYEEYLKLLNLPTGDENRGGIRSRKNAKREALLR